MAYRNVIWNHRDILDAIKTRPLIGARVADKTGLETSEIAVYVKQLEEWGMIKKGEAGHRTKPIMITSKGLKTLTLLNKLESLMKVD